MKYLVKSSPPLPPEKTELVFPMPPLLRKSLKLLVFKFFISTFSVSSCPANSEKNEVIALASLLAVSNSAKSKTVFEIEASF